MNPNSQDNSGQAVFLLLGLFVLVVWGIPAAYSAKATEINTILLVISKLQLKLFVPFSTEAQKAWLHISSIDPASLDWAGISAVVNYTGKWIRWPLALLLVTLGGISIFLGRTGNLTRKLNMETLLENNAEVFPCLRPVVGRGKYLLSPKSHDSGLWRMAQSPLQFAVEHQLLLDGTGTPYSDSEVLEKGLGYIDSVAFGSAYYDDEKVATCMCEQLGGGLNSTQGEHPVYSLPPLRKAIAAAFLAYAGGEKTVSIQILNDLSLSYIESSPKEGGDVKGICTALNAEHSTSPKNMFGNSYIGKVLQSITPFSLPLQAQINKVIATHKNLLDDPLLRRHSAFELVWFMALLSLARKKGVLASSQFLFLRPCDRPLWYCLNQCGGRVSWAEGAAAWSHYMEEERQNRALVEAHVANAVNGLKKALSAQGWLANSEETEGDTPPALTMYDARNEEDLIDEIF